MTQNLVGKTVSHYKILSLLGEGGMGLVYRAEDTKLQREVALKFLSPYLLGDEEDRSRFFNEARAAAALDHPNICAVHEIDEAEGHVYISMVRLEGRTLKERLEDGPLEPGEALDIAAQIAEGLEEAHVKGVVHRDIKPGNIMLTPRGRAVIMDFGLAKTGRSPDLTQLGTPVGTASYMSPEQARGETVDARSDIWALGALLYEMFTGRKAFRGDHEPAVMYSICHEQPLGLESGSAALSGGVRQLLLRCLEKNADLRFQEIGELRTALAAVGSGGSLGPAPRRARRPGMILWLPAAILLAAALWLSIDARGRSWLRGRIGAEPIPERKYLAILPFANIGGDPENQALGDGLHEYLSSKLMHLEGLRDAFWVVPAADVRKSEITSPMEARQVFGVNLAVVGSVQRQNGDIILTLNLTDAESHRILNSSVLEESANKASVLQADVLGALVEMLRVQLSPEETEVLEGGGTAVSLAQEYYLKGLGFMQDLDYLQRRAKLDAIDTAIDFFEQSLRKDPLYSLAELGIGEAFWQRYLWSREDIWIPKAISHLERSLELEAGMPEATVSLAVIFRELEQCERAIILLGGVVKDDASNIRALRELGESYSKHGEPEKADSVLRRAIEIRPDDWMGHRQLGMFYVRQFRFEEAIQEFQYVLDLTPENYFRGYTDMAGIYLYQQRLDEARALLEKSIAIKPSYNALSNLGTLYYMTGDYESALDAYIMALALHDHDYRIWGNLAAVQSRFEEDRETSLQSFMRAVELAEDQRVITPRDTALLSRLAGYYQALGEERKALDLLEAILRLDPDNAEALFQVGHCYEQIGYRAQAIESLGKALDLGYPLSKIENEQLLSSLREDSLWIDRAENRKVR